MNLFNWLRKSSPASVPSAATAVRRELSPTQMQELAEAQARASDASFRRITQDDTRRDLSPAKFDWHLKLCNYLWRQNPIAKRGVQNMRSFVASEGFRARATSPNPAHRAAVQRLLDQHWEINQWEDELSRRVETLAVEGEWIYLCPEPDRVTGHFRICKILPELVKEIRRHPRNAELLQCVELAEPIEAMVDGKPTLQKVFQLMRQCENGCLEGDVLYLGVNRLSGQTRGWSDLLVVADYIDVLDKLIFTETDRVQLQRAFAWDVTLKGENNEDKILATRDRILRAGPPKPGAVLVHHESEIWEPKSPSLQLSESIQLLRFVQAVCFGGLGMPEHWFSEGGDVNKACHSEDTETLTREGWKALADLRADEEIATYNPQTGAIEWHVANSFHTYDYTGEMIHIKGHHVDVLVTPDHRMYAKRDRNNKEARAYEIVEAQEMQQNRWWIPCAGDWEGGADKDFVLPSVATGCSRAIYPEVTIDGDLWAEFLGYFISEGHCHTKKDGCYLISISQKKPAGVLAIEKCIASMTALGFAFRRSKTSIGAILWQCSDKGLHTWLKSHCGMFAAQKCIPALCWSWTKRRLRILFDAMMLGDGTVDSRPGRKSGSYSTCSKLLADQMQLLCFKLGLRSQIGSGTRSKRVAIYPAREHMIGQNMVSRVQYSGRVYCYNVPNHLFITRRNGKIAVTHNTASEMGTPVWATIRDRKRQIQAFLSLAISRAMRCWRQCGQLYWVPEEHQTWEVVSRDPERNAYDLTGQMLQQLGEGLALGVEAGFLTEASAGAAYRKAASALGLGDFQDAPDPEDLKGAKFDAEIDLELKRPILESIYPLACCSN